MKTSALLEPNASKCLITSLSYAFWYEDHCTEDITCLCDPLSVGWREFLSDSHEGGAGVSSSDVSQLRFKISFTISLLFNSMNDFSVNTQASLMT